MSLVEMKNIHKRYGQVHALRGVNFAVDSGEVVGLVGDNGAGKSTLIKILTGVTPKDRGKIFWKGKEVQIQSPKEARNLGIETVYQDQTTADDLSVFKNIFLGREITSSLGPFPYVDKGKMKGKSKEILENLDLSIDSMDQEVRFCSGGERQGIAIARAMFFDAELVILDEPTTALSVAGAKKVLDYVKSLKKEEIGCVYISHNIQHVYPVSDRFVVLSKGEVEKKVRKEESSEEALIRTLGG